MRNSTPSIILGLLACCALSACVSAPVPQTQLTDAKVATSAAEAIGARDEPQAGLHLKMAENAIVNAEKLIASGDNEPALPLLVRARADAELALGLTTMGKRQAAAELALRRVDALERDLAHEGGKS